MDDFLSETRRFHEQWAEYLKQFKIDDEELKLASLESKKLQNRLNKESDLLLSKLFHFKLLKFKKSAPPVFGSFFNEGLKQSYSQALNRLKACQSEVTMANPVFKLLSNGNLCSADRNSNEAFVYIAVTDKELNQLAETPCQMSNGYRGFHLVELNKTVVLCLFGPKANADNISLSRIIEYDYDLKFIGDFGVNLEINYADAHKDKLYLLATRPDRKSRHIYVYDESLKLLDNIQLENGEGLPFYVPNSVIKMRVAEKYFVFLDCTKVLLMDRVDGMIKRTFSIGSSDFALDSSNDRIMACDGKTEKLVCFDFEAESFEIPLASLKKFELIDFVHGRFMFYDANSFCLYF